MNIQIPILTIVFVVGTSWIYGGEMANLTDWEPYAQRPAVMPVMSRSLETGSLHMASTGQYRCNGSWRRSLSVESGAYYSFGAEYSAKDVTLPRRSILARINWKDIKGEDVALPDYPATSSTTGDQGKMSGHFRAPQGAVAAQIELIFRWDERGVSVGIEYILIRLQPHSREKSSWPRLTIAPRIAPALKRT